jgi:outer membrane protein assembly factor BamB
MKPRPVLLVVLLLSAVACDCHRKEAAIVAEPPGAVQAEATTPPVPSIPEGELVTHEFEALNGPDHGGPPLKFRKGSVRSRRAPRAKRTEHGFEIQFASHATITTPTVYEGMVLVSGGFKSKELYAFDARSGEGLWALDLDDDGPSSTACEDGVCVFNTESCTLFALSARDGKLLWSHWLGDPLTSAPTIAGGRVFSSYPASHSRDDRPPPPSASHVLAAFDLHSGDILWQRWLDSDVMSAPVAAEGYVYVTTFSGMIIKLDQASGAADYAVRARATSAPVVTFAPDGSERLTYTRRGSQAEEAEAQGATEKLVHKRAGKGTGYVSASKRALYLDKTVQQKSLRAEKASAEDAHNGFAGGAPASAKAGSALAQVGVQSVSSMQNFQGSRVAHKEGRNVSTMGDEVIATDEQTGKELWRHKLGGDLVREGGALASAPIVVGKSSIVATLSGELLRLDEQTGRVLARYPVGDQVRSQPVAVDGILYMGTEHGRLVAIDTHDRSLTGWSTWGADAQRSGVAR